MVQAAAIVIGVALLGLAGAALERQGGAWAVAGALMGIVGGAVAGLLVALVGALAITPGACVAVLCPSCYQEPPADQVWRAGLVYFTVLGVLAGLLPGAAFRSGFDLGAAAMVLASASYWTHYGAGLTILLGFALAALGWAIHRAAGARLDGGHDARGSSGEPRPPTSGSFWDGSSWQAPAAGPTARHP